MNSRRAYFDTSVILSALLGPQEPNYQHCVDAITAAQHGTYQAVTSALSVAEAVGAGRHRNGVSASAARKNQRKALEFAQGLGALFVDITERDGRRAAELSITYALKGPDALHLALAANSGCSHLFTCDNDLLKIGGQLAGLVVGVPDVPGQPALPSD